MPSAKLIASFPDIPEMVRICKAIAMLDAILCEDWELRYYSFNSQWSKGDPTQMMASMRNGSGDDYFIWFSSAGAAIKGFAHESAMSPANNNGHVYDGIFDHVPQEFAEFLAEPAFEMESTTFCIWRSIHDRHWQTGDIKYPEKGGADPDGAESLLQILDGHPGSYVRHARNLFDMKLDETDVSHVYRLKSISLDLLKRLGSNRALDTLAKDIAEIGYRQGS